MSLDIKFSNKNPKMSHKQKTMLAVFSLINGLLLLLLAFFLKNDNPLFSFNNSRVLRFFVNHRFEDLTNIFKFITDIMSPIHLAIFAVILSILLIIIRRSDKKPLFLIGSILFASVLSVFLKGVIANPRPETVFMIEPFETDFSFPSGHTLNIFILCITLSYIIYSQSFSMMNFLILNFLSLVIIATLATTRLYLGYHWMSDIVASFSIGQLIFATTIFIDIIIDKKLK